MKKLMTIAAAALCGVAFAEGEIASANIVGYQNKDVARLLSNQIPTFEKIGSEGTKLSEFTPFDENGDPLADEITVQFYSDRGKMLESYTWTLGENIDTGYEDGWPVWLTAGTMRIRTK